MIKKGGEISDFEGEKKRESIFKFGGKHFTSTGKKHGGRRLKGESSFYYKKERVKSSSHTRRKGERTIHDCNRRREEGKSSPGKVVSQKKKGKTTKSKHKEDITPTT